MPTAELTARDNPDLGSRHKSHATPQQCTVLGRESVEHKRCSRYNCDPVESGLVVERDQHRSESRAQCTQYHADRDVDPEQGRSLLVCYLKPLDSRTAQAGVSEEFEKPGQPDHHSDQSKIFG